MDLQPRPQPPSPPSSENPTGHAVAGLVLGIIGLLAWCIPLFGFPTTIVGLVLSLRGMRSTSRGVAIGGVVMCIIGLAATLANAVFGAYLGATGRHPLFR